MINMVKLPTNKSSLFLRVAKGHFATIQQLCALSPPVAKAL